MKKKSKTPMSVPELIAKLKQTAKCGGTIMGCYTIRIHQNCIVALIEDLECTNNAAETYWKMREEI